MAAPIHWGAHWAGWWRAVARAGLAWRSRRMAIVVLAVLLYLPSIDVGRVGDDFLHWQALRTEAPLTQVRPGSVRGLFALVDGGPKAAQTMRTQGRLLWTAADDLQLSFMRPLAELTHVLDGRWWPDSPVWMHLHSLAWYALLVWLVVRWYEVLAPSQRWARWAALAYAVSTLHSFAVTWLAARNQLMSACFVVLAMLAFHAWRTQRSGWRHAGWLACGAYVLALLCAEAGVGLLAYLVAYQLTLDPQARDAAAQGRRWRGVRLWLGVLQPLWPFALITVVWRLCHVAWGYGAVGSGSYIDPGHEPWRFALALLTRIPTYAMADLSGVSAAVGRNLSAAGRDGYGLVAAVVLLAWAVTLGRLGVWRTPWFRFHALGALLALVPACAIEPADRVLIVSELGACGLVGALVLHLRNPGALRRRVGWLCAAFTAWVVVVHVVIFPLLTLAQSVVLKRVLSPGVDDVVTLSRLSHCVDCDVVLLNAPTPALTSFYYPQVLAHAEALPIHSLFSMAFGARQDLSIEVLDAHRVRMQVHAGRMDRLERDVRTRPFVLGQDVRCGAVLARVSALDADGEPTEVLFSFERPLTDARWRFFRWGADGEPERVALRPGQIWHLKPPSLGDMLRRYL